MATSSSTAQPGVRAGLAGVALVVSSAALAVPWGRAGVVVAVAGVAVGVLTTGVYGVAVHHLGVLALAGTPRAPELILLETAATFLLAADAAPGRRLQTGVLFVPLAVVFAVGTVTVAAGRGFPAAAVLLSSVVAVAIYLCRRYARVRLGLTSSTPGS
jgi:hypothetical protein